MGQPRVTESAIQRAINAAKMAGIDIGSVTINNLDGTVRIETARQENNPAINSPGEDTPKQWT